jgi:hypothetical protein
MPYQDSSYQDSSYQDSNNTGGGGSPPPTEPPPFGPLVLWTAVLDDLQIFFDDLAAPVHEHGNDQNSYYDDPEDSSPLGALFLQDFQWMPSVQNQAGFHYFDSLTTDADPELLVLTDGTSKFEADFSGGHLSVQQMNDLKTYAMAINGITIFGVWHEGAPTTTDGDTIVVTGGYWSFDYTGFDASFYNNNPPPPPPRQRSRRPRPMRQRHGQIPKP